MYRIKKMKQWKKMVNQNAKIKWNMLQMKEAYRPLINLHTYHSPKSQSNNKVFV